MIHEKLTPDQAFKLLFSDSAAFADLCNYLLFGGDSVIKAEELEMLTPDSIRGGGTRIRDILSRASIREDDKCIYVLIGLEGQYKAERFMIERIMNYNARNLLAQAEEAKGRDIKLKPVITIVVYFGKYPWPYERNLYSTLEIPSHMMKFMKKCEPDRIFLLIDPYRMSDREIMKLGPIISPVLLFVKHQMDPDMLVRISKRRPMRRLDRNSVEAIKSFTNSDIFEYTENEDGTLDMCVGIEIIKQRSEAEGKLKATASSVKHAMKNFGLSADVAMKGLGVKKADRIIIKEMISK